MSDWDKFHIGDKVRVRNTVTVLEVVDYVPTTAHDYIVREEDGYAFIATESDLVGVDDE